MRRYPSGRGPLTDKLRDIFISNDTPMTKNYLRFLVEKIEVLDDRVVIEAKARNAVALMADPAPMRPGDVNRPRGRSHERGGNGSDCWTRTSDPAVNSRLLYRLS